MAAFDVIVLGVGGMGSAACYHLSRRGLSVLGLEQFEFGHDRGSSHGQSRVIRKAYFEDPRYVPLLHRTYELWRELEAASGETLMKLAGCLNLGPSTHPAMLGLRRSVDEHALRHELLDAVEIRHRWPVLHTANGDIGVYEEEAGFLAPEHCIAAHVSLARKQGADLRERQRVTSWRATGRHVMVRTESDSFEGRHLIVSAGPWLPELAAELKLPLRVERQVQAWFSPASPVQFMAGRLPVFIHFVADRAYYVVPIAGRHARYDRAIKAARHHGGQATTAESVDRTVNEADEAEIRWYLQKFLPAADGPMVASKVCLYTNTPDEHFLIDRDPRRPNVLIAGGFSGHGFKFAPVVGEILADLITQGRTRHGIELFSLARFG
jgi:sarcosine oxidase